LLHFYDRAGFALALTLNLDPALHRLLSDRIAALDGDLIDQTEYLIVQPGDTKADIVSAIGWSPLVNPIDGCRYGDPGFIAPWDWLQRHQGWYEMIVTVGNGGFAYIIFIEDAPDADAVLLRLCRTHV
jgi:hypothetical protein